MAKYLVNLSTKYNDSNNTILEQNVLIDIDVKKELFQGHYLKDIIQEYYNKDKSSKKEYLVSKVYTVDVDNTI